MRSVPLALRSLALALVVLALEARAHAQPASRPPWLGVALAPAVRGAGARVTEVIPGTPAEYVGLVAGDVVVALDGAAIAAPADLIARIGAHAVGDTVAIAVQRGGKPKALSVTLAPRLDEGEVLERRLLDQPAPAFALPLAVGRGSGALAALGGKVVVVEFFATWCGPCKATYRPLDGLDADPEIVVLGIASEAPAALAEFARRHAIGFALAHDAGGRVAQRFGAGATPTVVVIDRRGVVRHVGVGAGPVFDRALAAARAAAGPDRRPGG